MRHPRAAPAKRRGGLGRVVAGIPIQNEDPARAEERARRRAMGSARSSGIRIGGVLHDEVEPASGRLEIREHALDVATKDLGALQAPQAEVAQGDLEITGSRSTAVMKRGRARRRAAGAGCLRPARRRAPWGGAATPPCPARGTSTRPQARPVAGERDGRQRVAARDEPALVALIDDADQPRQRGLRLEDHAPGRAARRLPAPAAPDGTRQSAMPPSMITACPVMKRDSSDAR